MPRWGRLLTALVAVLLATCLSSVPAGAATCNPAASQGSTGPSNWQTYCWLDLSSFSDATARTSSGQSLSYTLPDGTTMTFRLRITGPTLSAIAAPSWTGAAVGNTAFLGISGRPVLYQGGAGTSTITISNIALTPPPGSGAITAYMFVGADAESTNQGESLSFQTNGGGWQVLDQVGPVSGNAYPATSGAGTSTFTETGVAGTVGAYIVGSNTPTTVTTTMVGGGLQGTMFAVRFASIRLNLQIQGARVSAADQFAFDIAATSGGAALASGTSTGSGLGPFPAAALSTASALPLRILQRMAAGSTSAIGQYQLVLTCTNSGVGSSTPLPNGVITTSYNFGALQFGDAVVCQFVTTPFPHLTLRKTLGAGGRQFAGDQFTLKIVEGANAVATTTTTGTGSTLSSASTPQVQATAGTTYQMLEEAAGTTVLSQYTVAMTCSNASGLSATPLPSSPGGSVIPQMGDVISCTINNTKRAANASLTLQKTSSVVSDPVNSAINPLAVPGAVVRYTVQVSNTGPSPVDNNSVVIVDALPPQLEVGTDVSAAFSQGAISSNLAFTPSTDLRYSNAATPPSTFGACGYSPSASYDPAVRYVCMNPKGIMAGSTGIPPSFTISFNARVK